MRRHVAMRWIEQPSEYRTKNGGQPEGGRAAGRRDRQGLKLKQEKKREFGLNDGLHYMKT
ncbi:MAG TPA: hypothetical protein VHR72_06005 [Gemmataceae bacterium]|nr:hypothetical protein [Gemmataceae bacterium]